MKILGHARLKARTESVNIGEAEDDGTVLKLVLKAPRLNSVVTFDRLLEAPPPPEPPATGDVMRDARKLIIKDDAGHPIVARNYKDPAYLERLRDHADVVIKHERAKTIAMLLECLKRNDGDGPAQVELGTNRKDYEKKDGSPGPKGGLVDFFDAVWDEFEEAGFDIVTLGRLTDAALKLAGVREEEFSDAKEALGAGGN